MAVRKTSTRRNAKKPPLKSAKGAGNRMPVSAAFRIFLLIVIIIAFFMLLPVIKNLRQNAKATETEQGTGNREQGTEEDEGRNSNSKEQVAGSKERDKREEEKRPQTEKPATPEQKEPQKKPQAEKPAAPEQKPPEQKPSTPAPVSTPPVKPAETRGSIYLIQESNKMLVKVNRNLNVNTPLTDSINALLAGPTPDEIMRGIESFVPEGSRLLKPPTIKGNTVELDFNQEFRYNQRGREGCEAQIKQIVWTATEFSNVKDVQFRIDGNIVDFLSEGVVISSPIGR
ncbi:MAG: GerMN domain-containing protein [Treponema sp.]|jgi:spore germination protein GerM|nr:GerMN domain-containing protein [Treponema sp.]